MFVVTFNGNGIIVDEQKRNVASGTAIGELPILVRSRYTFLGWFMQQYGGIQIDDTYIVESDIALYAHWNPIAIS